jgi:putative FmdB family regulatory protein
MGPTPNLQEGRESIMAVYVYRCKECGEEFDKRMPISEFTSEFECPKCGAKAPNIVVSANWRRSAGWYARLDSGSSVRPGYASGWS